MSSHVLYYFWDYWNLNHKVTFDGEARIIYVNEGVTFLDFRSDVYSAWKEWVQLPSHPQNASYLDAMRSVGGDPIDETNGVYLGATYFLRNGWRIKTWEGNHRLIVDGNVYTEENQPVFLPINGNFTTEIILRTSNIVDQVTPVAPVIDYAAIAAQVRAELAAELARIDVEVSSRASQTSVDNLPSQIATEVWSTPTENLTNKTTIGGYIARVLLSIPKFLGLK